MRDDTKITTLDPARQAAPHGIEITEITVSPTDKSTPVRAYVRIVLNDAIVVAQIKVIEGKGGLFVTFPTSYSQERGRRRGICYPIKRDLHAYMAEEILREYRAAQEVVNG